MSCPHKAAFGSRNGPVTSQWWPTWSCSKSTYILGSSPVAKASRSFGSVNTNICDNIQKARKKLSFSIFLKIFLIFFFPHIIYILVFHSRNSGGSALSGKLLGLAWRLHKGERHSVSYHQDLREGRAISDVQWHVGNRRTDQLHHAVSVNESPCSEIGTSARWCPGYFTACVMEILFGKIMSDLIVDLVWKLAS